MEIYEVISINDPRILAVPVRENKEKLVSLLDMPRTYLPSMVKTGIGISDSQNMFVRESVKRKIEDALELLDSNLSLLFIEGYRKYSFQKKLFNDQVKKSGSKQAAQKYVSDPDVFSPHVTGAAIDIAIVDKDLQLLDFAPGNPFEYGEKVQMDYPNLTEAQKANRTLLKHIMTTVGFVNYPNEWWHWSYGDKYWGYITQNTAIYDSVRLENT